MDSVVPPYYNYLHLIQYYAWFFLSLAVLSIFVLLGARALLKANDKIPIELIDHFNKAILALSSILFLVYATEIIIAWYSGYIYEQFAFFKRAIGFYWFSYMALNISLLVPQIFWKQKWRRSVKLSLIAAIVLTFHLWFEKIMIWLMPFLPEGF